MHDIRTEIGVTDQALDSRASLATFAQRALLVGSWKDFS
jgi:hypothetical protein